MPRDESDRATVNSVPEFEEDGSEQDELGDWLSRWVADPEAVEDEVRKRRDGPDAVEDEIAASLGLVRELRDLGNLLPPPRRPEGRASGGDPEQFGRFYDLQRIGSGGGGRVYRAWDGHLRRTVALKLLDPDGPTRGDDTTSSGERMLREARALAALRHPNIVGILETGTLEGQSYLAMELVDGESLQVVLEVLRGANKRDVEVGERAGMLAERLRPVSARVAFLARLAEAVGHCHAHGVVHRDLKPGNVLVTERGEPVIVDFGLSHRPSEEQDGVVTIGLVGTPAYLAPEQLSAKRTGASPASDVFALGVLAYELLTLRHPFAGETLLETHAAIQRCEPQRPRTLAQTLPRDLELVTLACLRRDPTHRYPEANPLAADLVAVQELRAISIAPPGAWGLLVQAARRHRRSVAWAGAGLALALVLFAWQVFRGRQVMAREIREGLQAASAQPFDADGQVEALKLLGSVRERASAFDRSILGRVSGGGMERKARADIRVLRDRLFDQADREAAEQLEEANFVERHDALQELATRFVVPDYVWKVQDPFQEPRPFFEGRGHFRLGSGSTLWQPIGTIERIQDWRLQPVESRAVDAQTYFLLRTPADPLTHPLGLNWNERDVVVDPLDPEHTLADAEPPPEWITDRMKLLDVGAITTPDGVPRSRFGSLYVLDHEVSWSDLDTAMGEDWTRTARVSTQARGAPDQPACIRGSRVLEFARAVGMRLPSATELIAIYQAELENDELTPWPRQEYVGFLDREWFLGALRLDADGTLAAIENSRFEAMKSDSSQNTTFRLVIGVGDPLP